MRKIYIILIIIIALLVLGFVGLIIYTMKGKPQLFPAKVEIIPSETQYSDDSNLLKQALLEKNVSYCDKLKELKKDDCLFYIAETYNDTTICRLITDSALNTKCLEVIAAREYVSSQDTAKCLALTDQTVKNDCLSSIFRQQTDLQFCSALENEDKILCEDIINTNLAFAAKNKASCAKIQAKNERLNCESAIDAMPLDSDNDGISNYLERSYGTDPFKADTDNDGKNDKQELERGSNPTIAD